MSQSRYFAAVSTRNSEAEQADLDSWEKKVFFCSVKSAYFIPESTDLIGGVGVDIKDL